MNKNKIIFAAGAVLMIVISIIGVSIYGGDEEDADTTSPIIVQPDAVQGMGVPSAVPVATSGYSAVQVIGKASIQGYYGSNPGGCYDGAVYLDGSCWSCNSQDPYPTTPPAQTNVFPYVSSGEVICLTASNGACSSGKLGSWKETGSFTCCITNHPYAYDNMCNADAPGGQTHTCTDTDSGKDYYKKGTTESTYNGKHTDYCDGTYNGNPAVKEYSCGDCPSGVSGSCVHENRASRSGYVCNDGKLEEGNLCNPPCAPKNTVTCGQSISPYSGCYGPCQQGTKCPSGKSCDGNSCISDNVCTPATKKCEGNNLETCKSDGSGWNSQYCPYGCENNQCKGIPQECTPGQTGCVGDSLKTCNSNGQWGSPTACPASKPKCEQGSCVVGICQSKTCPDVCADLNNLNYAGYCNDANGQCVYSTKLCDNGCDGNACKDEPICNNNGVCEAGESTANCPNDCPPPVCNNNGVCDGSETTANCPNDCPICNNNNVCEAGEDNSNCPNDCPDPNQCDHDGTCEAGESTANCPDDCPPPVCNNNAICEEGETFESCPNDCEETDNGILVIIGIFTGILAVFGGGVWFIVKKM